MILTLIIGNWKWKAIHLKKCHQFGYWIYEWNANACEKSCSSVHVHVDSAKFMQAVQVQRVQKRDQNQIKMENTSTEHTDSDKSINYSNGQKNIFRSKWKRNGSELRLSHSHNSRPGVISTFVTAKNFDLPFIFLPLSLCLDLLYFTSFNGTNLFEDFACEQTMFEWANKG